MRIPLPASRLSRRSPIPCFRGSLANYPAAGQTSFQDNSSTAVYSISNSLYVPAPASLLWGENGTDPPSELISKPSSVTGNSSGTYQIGTLFFQNSDSTLQALIFGATINFYLGSVNPNAYLGSDSSIITTTSNIYGQPGGLTSGDDDYVNICGNNSQICGQSIEAVENSEGGAGLAVNLYGSFLGRSDSAAAIGVTRAGPKQRGERRDSDGSAAGRTGARTGCFWIDGGRVGDGDSRVRPCAPEIDALIALLTQDTVWDWACSCCWLTNP